MKLSLIPLVIFSFASFSVFSEVTLEDLNDIEKLVKEKKYEKALERHIWFHEKSRDARGMAGVRLSFALNDWLDLAKLYPPAMLELERIRDDNAAILKSGNGGYENYSDFSAINRTLEEQNKTIAMFKYLHKHYPKQAKVYYYTAEDLLIEHNEIALVEEYLSEPIFKYETIRHDRERDLSYARRNKKRAEESVSYANERYLKETKKLISVLKKLNRLSEAEEVFNRSQSYFPNEEIRATFLD